MKHIHRLRTLLLTASALALALLPARSPAASITWGAPTLIGADTNVSTTGSLLYAYNIGDAAVAGTTLNGVAFASFAVPAFSSSPASQGSVTITTGASTFYSSNADTSPNAPYTGLSAAYRTLVSSGAVANDSTQALNLGLGGLTLGNTYQLQVWSMDATSTSLTFNSGSTSLYTAGNAVTLDNNNLNATGGVGQWVTGTFTANATTQTIAITPGAGGYEVLNAFQVRTVPEPSAWLSMVGGIGMLMTFRRKRAA